MNADSSTLANASIGEEVVLERFDKNVDMPRYSFATVEKFTKHTPAHVVLRDGSRTATFDLQGIVIDKHAGLYGKARRYAAGETRQQLELANVAADDKLAEIKEADRQDALAKRRKALAANPTALRSVQWIQGAPGSIGILHMTKENGERLTMFVTVELHPDIEWDEDSRAPHEFANHILRVIGFGDNWYKGGFSTSSTGTAHSIDEVLENLLVAEF